MVETSPYTSLLSTRLPIEDEDAAFFAELEQLEAAKAVYESYKEYERKPHKVADKRFQEVNFAEAIWKLRFLGYIRHKFSDRGKKFVALQDYLRFKRELPKGLDSAQKSDLKQESKRLNRIINAKADFHVLTISNFAGLSLVNSIKPKLVEVDEAARASETESLIPMVWSNPAVILWLADPAQGMAMAFAKEDTLLSMNQTPLSLFQR